MKMIVAALTLLAAQAASANVMNIRLVPCTSSMESICAKVYQDFTSQTDYKGTEMAFVSDGETRGHVTVLAEKLGGQMLQVDAKTFTVFDGRTVKLQINRVLKVVEAPTYKPNAPSATYKFGAITK